MVGGGSYVGWQSRSRLYVASCEQLHLVGVGGLLCVAWSNYIIEMRISSQHKPACLAMCHRCPIYHPTVFQCPILYITPYSLNLQTLPVTHAYPWAGRLLPPIYSHTMEILPLTLTQSTNHSTYSSLPMDWKGGVLPGPDHRAMPLHRPP